MALQFVTGGILTRNDTDDVGGSPAGVDLNLPYDIGFTGGFNDDMVPEVVTIRTYGEMIMGRAGTFIGCWGYMDSPPSGSTTIDILNQIGGNVPGPGISIYSTKPQFTQTNDLTSPDALLSVISSEFHAGGGQQPFTSFNAGDKITFKVITLGSTPGSGMRVTPVSYTHLRAHET